MWELIRAGGWLMLPLLICSIALCAIVAERAIRLNLKKNVPPTLLAELSKQLGQAAQGRQLSPRALATLQQHSVLGDILATGIASWQHGPEFTERQMQTRANALLHGLERHLNFLGTIGAIAPLLGLLGTVVGIIEAFMAVNRGGVTDPAMLASGVSQALITTAAGMTVAIPALIAYRFFQRRINDIASLLEVQANQLINIMFFGELASDRQADRAALIPDLASHQAEPGNEAT